MKKLIMVAAIAAVALAGCRSLTVENRGTDKGWKVTHWSHWLNSDIDGMSATIGTDGTVSFSLNGVKSSPSEEFNRSMQTYMGAAVQLGQISRRRTTRARALRPRRRRLRQQRSTS